MPQWLDAVRRDDLPSLHTLAAGIDRDRDAVIAGLTLPWSSGVVEGHVNRIKMLKRRMSGPFSFVMSQLQTRFGPSATSSGTVRGGWTAWRRRSRTSPCRRRSRYIVDSEHR
ncbi:transposase [Streptomyces sp. NBC_00147]|uniref:transposase n=1 Tax=Streptomyces sp. NBC_00147 TaxID=2975667 RepID=UPI00386F35CE